MFEMAMWLMCISVIVEMIIVWQIPFLRDILMYHGFLALAFSLGLSWCLGAMFGAAGMTVLIAATGSTMITWIIYRGLGLALKE